ncbi:MAG: TIGR04211 family SH3 domain-containing protein [Chromatiales bacterium]|jgi:SH3 domain protein
MRRLLLCLLLGLLTPVQAAYITDKLVAGLYEEAKVSDKPLKALPSGTPLEVVTRSNGFVKVRTPDGMDGWVEATYLTDEKPARSLLLDAQAKLSILQKQLEQAKGRLEGEPGVAADDKQLQDKLVQARGQVSQLDIQLQAARVEVKNAQQQLQQAKENHAAETKHLKQQAQQQLQQIAQQNKQLQQRIDQVAELLQIPRPATDDAEHQLEVEVAPAFDWSDWKSNYWLWLVPLLALLAGFIGGVALMDYRMRKHFGGVRF